MYILHYYHHCHQHYQLQHYHYKYLIQKSTPDEENFSPKSTFDLTFVCFAMIIFQYVVMFYANHLISEWNTHSSNYTHQLRKTTGLGSSAIASLPVFTHSGISEKKLGVLVECVVCLATIEDSELVKVLPNCTHLFHVECINTWLRLHSSCPICRCLIEPKEERRTKM